MLLAFGHSFTQCCRRLDLWSPRVCRRSGSQRCQDGLPYIITSVMTVQQALNELTHVWIQQFNSLGNISTEEYPLIRIH